MGLRQVAAGLSIGALVIAIGAETAQKLEEQAKLELQATMEHVETLEQVNLGFLADSGVNLEKLQNEILTGENTQIDGKPLMTAEDVLFGQE